MGYLDEQEEKNKKEILEVEKKEQAKAISAAVNVAVAAAISPLQKEIVDLKGELRELKKTAEKPNMAVLDDATRKDLRSIMINAAKGIDSYKVPVYALFGFVFLLAGTILWNSYRLNELSEDTNSKYDVVTGILSGDRSYWWDGENFIASRKAPEAKRLQEAVEHYNKIEQMKKQGGTGNVAK